MQPKKSYLRDGAEQHRHELRPLRETRSSDDQMRSPAVLCGLSKGGMAMPLAKNSHGKRPQNTQKHDGRVVQEPATQACNACLKVLR